MPALKLKHWPASFLHGPPVPAAQSSQRATTSGSKQRRKLVGQVFATESSNSRHALTPSEMQGPNPISQLEQCSGVVVWVVVALVVGVVVGVVVDEVVGVVATEVVGVVVDEVVGVVV